MAKNTIPALNERFLEVVSALGFTGYSFSAKMNISQATFSNIRYGRRKPNIELIQRLLEENPEVDADWLMLGKGAMFRKVRKGNTSGKLGQMDRLEQLMRKSVGIQMERSIIVDGSISDMEERLKKIERSLSALKKPRKTAKR